MNDRPTALMVCAIQKRAAEEAFAKAYRRICIDVVTDLGKGELTEGQQALMRASYKSGFMDGIGYMIKLADSVEEG